MVGSGEEGVQVYAWPQPGLTRELGRGPVGLAPEVFVYFVEQHPRFLPLVQPIFDGTRRGRWQAVTSTLTLIETQMAPCRDGDVALADRYETVLRSRGVRLVALDPQALQSAARLCRRCGVAPAAAIQLAAALSAGCTAFVTNQASLASFSDLPVIVLDRYRAH
jgi:hypothetical protein